jgi:glycosyltransferase involved in cell wall biosynthesis
MVAWGIGGLPWTAFILASSKNRAQEASPLRRGSEYAGDTFYTWVSRALKILLACSQYPPMKTGYARVAGQLATWFTRFGHEVDVITEGRGCYRIGKVAFLDKTGKAMFKGNHDIVQVIGPTPFFSEQCVKYAKKERLPVVYHLSAFPGLASYYHNRVGGIIDSLYKNLNLYRKIRNVDLVVFNTHDFAEYCASFYEGPSEVIPDGVDLDGFNGHSEGHEVVGNRILFVGQLRRYKGLPYLVMAIKKLRDAGRDVVLDVVGGGPDRQRILSLIAKVRLQDTVFLHGELSDEELDKMYERSRVFVLPSIQGESFGIVLLEAAAHGIPVIASDLPGVREVVTFLGGALAHPKDSDDLATTLEKVLDDPSPRHAPIGLTDRFRWKNVAGMYLKCYEKITRIPLGTELSPVVPLKEPEQLELIQ